MCGTYLVASFSFFPSSLWAFDSISYDSFSSLLFGSPSLFFESLRLLSGSRSDFDLLRFLTAVRTVWSLLSVQLQGITVFSFNTRRFRMEFWPSALPLHRATSKCSFVTEKYAFVLQNISLLRKCGHYYSVQRILNPFFFYFFPHVTGYFYF